MTTIRNFDSAYFTYSSDTVNIDFASANSVAIVLSTMFEGTLDPFPNTISTTRSATINEPNTITFTLGSQCTEENGQNIIDLLHKLHTKNMSNNLPEKGVLKVVEKTSGETIVFPDTVLKSDPLFNSRTIELGGGSSNYTVEFFAANPVVSNG